jgi:hypothetical protein
VLPTEQMNDSDFAEDSNQDAESRRADDSDADSHRAISTEEDQECSPPTYPGFLQLG